MSNNFRLSQFDHGFKPHAEEIVRALGGKRNRAACPVCKAEGRDRSGDHLAVTERDGVTLFHCHAGCSQEAVLRALQARGLWRDRTPYTAAQRAAWARQRRKAEDTARRVRWYIRGLRPKLEAVKADALEREDFRLVELMASRLYLISKPAGALADWQWSARIAPKLTVELERLGRVDEDECDRLAAVIVAMIAESQTPVEVTQ